MRRRTTPRILNRNPNTFIGGVGASYITNVSELALILDVLESNIANFQIDVNNNVSFFINVNYSFGFGSVFSNQASLTYYIDLIGNVNNLGRGDLFDGCINFKYAYFPNADDLGFLGAQGSWTTVNLQHINFENAVTSRGRDFLNTSKIKTVNLNSLTTISTFNLGYNYMPNMTVTKRLNIKNITTLPDINYVSDVIFTNINTVCTIYYNSVFGVTDRRSHQRATVLTRAVGDQFQVNGLTYTAISGAPATDGEYQVDDTVNINTVTQRISEAINNDTRIGSIGVVTSQFNLNRISFTSSVLGVGGNATTLSNVTNIPLSFDAPTFDYGVSLHPVLRYCQSRGCALIECSAPIAVNAPTSLSAINITINSVDLTFTVPAANANGTDGYEVWVDDGTIYRKLFEYAEIITTGDTLDLAEVVADVGTISGTKIKIRAFDGHFNFSEFSNEITIP